MPARYAHALRRRPAVVPPLILLLLAIALPLAAQTSPAQGDPSVGVAAESGPDAIPEKAGKVLRARRVVGQPPVIDGVLDDPVWAAADSASDLVQWEPENMAAMTERTVVRIAYDDRYIYVGVRLYDSDPAGIETGLGRRDDLPPSDGIYVGFDPQHDHLTGYVFSTNPSGVQRDARFFDDTSPDSDYNSVWEVETRIDEAGWTAEYRIPFSQMRFGSPAGGETVWGLAMRREIQRRNETGQWVGRPRGERGQVSRWGHLIFEEPIRAPRRMELLPFAATRREAPSGVPAETGFDAGLDLRLGLGSSTTLSGTLNPDFGQVEADPAVLNLTVFETFFPEKRPFFLEDGRIFVPPYGMFQLFHSRRIGRRPGYFRPFGPTDVVLERPDQTTILGATKLTGKGGDYTYGAMSALTSAEYATVDSVWSDGVRATRRDRLIEPMTSFNAVRLQRDVLGGSSNVGILATGVVREAAPDAFTGGVDYKLRWGRNQWEWNGHWAVADAPGPDGRATGIGGVSNLSYNGKHWSSWLHFDYMSPDFRINDLGFMRARIDATGLAGSFGYTDPDPGTLRRWGVNLNAGESRTTDGLRLNRSWGLSGNLQLLNFWGAYGFVNLSDDAFDDLETRGGPPVRSPASVFWAVGVNSDPRKSWSLRLNTSGRHSEESGWRLSVGPRLELRPSARLQLGVSTSYETADDEAQWITNRDVTGDEVVDYVFGRLRRDVINITLRATVAIHRDLTFEGFLQPFVAVGDYTDLKRLARPRSFDFDPIDPAALGFDPDFNSKSLRGTLVMRWEYVRGSTIFLVWNLSGRDAARPGVFDPLRDFGDVFGAPLDNVFMIKANYWLAM